MLAQQGSWGGRLQPSKLAENASKNMHGISARTLRCYSLKDACALVCRGLRKQARRHKNAKHAINEVVRERDVGTWEQIPHVNLVGSMGRRDLYGNSRLMFFPPRRAGPNVAAPVIYARKKHMSQKAANPARHSVNICFARGNWRVCPERNFTISIPPHGTAPSAPTWVP